MIRACLILATLFTALAACKPEPPQQRATPAMWEVSDADTQLIIIGSVHALPAHIDWLHGRVTEVAASADELILELPPGGTDGVPALLQRMAGDEAVTSVEDRIGSAQAARVTDMLSAAGIDDADANRTESWALVIALGAVTGADAGLSVDNGVERRLTLAFAANNRPVTGLETAAGQLTAFDSLPPATQDRMLALAESQADNAQHRLRQMLNVWAAGDVAALEQMMADDVGSIALVEETLVTARNRRWADALTTRMQRPGRVMIAVGAGHLVGPNALIAMMQVRGFTVRRVQ
jgi:uncharacterized protein